MKLNAPLLVVGVTLVGALAYVLWNGFGRDPHAVPFMLTGKPAPEFKLEQWSAGSETAAAGPERTLASFAGKPVVLNFWSSWCVPCKVEHPVLEWGHQRYGDRVSFVGVVYQDTRENVGEFLRKQPSPYTQLFDGGGRAAVDYGLAGVPETYFITKDGRIAYKHVGPLRRDELAFRVEALVQP